MAATALYFPLLLKGGMEVVVDINVVRSISLCLQSYEGRVWNIGYMIAPSAGHVNNMEMFICGIRCLALFIL